MRWLIILLLLIPFVNAETGCLLYEDSPFYCQEIDKIDAEIECNGDCGKDFVPGACLADECKVILCKSTCTNTFKGACTGGEVTDEEWCKPGCCQFAKDKRPFCSYEDTKWECETTAQNKGVQTYAYRQLDAISCQNECSKSFVAQLAVIDGLTKNKVEPGVVEEKGTDLFPLWVLLIIIVALGIIYLFFSYRKVISPLFNQERVANFFSKLIPTRYSEGKLNRMKIAFNKKFKGKKRDQQLRELGTKPYSENIVIENLQKVVKEHERDKKRKRHRVFWDLQDVKTSKEKERESTFSKLARIGSSKKR